MSNLLIPYLAWFRDADHGQQFLHNDETLVDHDTFTRYAAILFAESKKFLMFADLEMLSKAAHMRAVKVRCLAVMLNPT